MFGLIWKPVCGDVKLYVIRITAVSSQEVLMSKGRWHRALPWDTRPCLSVLQLYLYRTSGVLCIPVPVRHHIKDGVVSVRGFIATPKWLPRFTRAAVNDPGFTTIRPLLQRPGIKCEARYVCLGVCLSLVAGHVY